MTPRQECEFRLLQYVPDPVRNEFVHVGVLLRTMSGRIAVKFTSDWRRVRCLDPEADIDLLEELGSELGRRFEAEPEGNLMHVLENSFSNSIQVTRPKGYLAESVDAGVEELMRMYVESPKRERVPRLAGRAAILEQMKQEFERLGVWQLMRKKIAASEYTRPGDPLKLDVGYQFGRGVVGGFGSTPGGPGSPNGTVRIFQAISLAPPSGLGGAVGAEMAKILAFSANSLMAGVQQVEKASLELTAIVEPLRMVRQGTKDKDQGSGIREQAKNRDQEDAEADSERMEAYRFAVETMEEYRIRVLTTADLGRVAETARRELRI